LTSAINKSKLNLRDDSLQLHYSQDYEPHVRFRTRGDVNVVGAVPDKLNKIGKTELQQEGSVF